MNNNELIEHVSTKTGMDKTGVKKIVDAAIAEIVDAAKRGEDVALAGFGQFKVKDTPARQGRNPATGAAMEIAASRKLSFAPAKAIKDALKA